MAHNELAWTAGLVAWWVGLELSRGYLAAQDNFRYNVVGSAFVVLGLVPEHWRDASRRRLADSGAAAGAAILVACLVIYVNQGDVLRQGAPPMPRS